MSSQVYKYLALSSLTAVVVGCSGDTIFPDPALVERVDATAEQCANGGVVITTGVDTNGNGTLEVGEVRDSQVVCNGTTGDKGSTGQDGLRTLVVRSEEPAGANCTQGGEKVEAGVDDNGDGTLDAEEIDTTTYVCVGQAGQDAPALLTETSTAVEAECPEAGGTRFTAGLDDNRNGTLEAEEVDVTRVVCSGETGEVELVVVDSVGPGADCQAGGQRVRAGIDDNGDGLLQDNEVDDATFLCDPTRVLTEVTALNIGSIECPGGGQRIDVGVDANADGVLVAAEVTSTTFVCSGADGRRVLTRRTVEPAGANCVNGGERIAIGLDDNGNQLLEAAEEDTVTFSCDGAPGAPGLNGAAVRVTPEPAGANCAGGGLKVETGPDANGDGVLSDAEVASTSYACNGQVANVLTDVTPEPPGTNCTNGGSKLSVGLDTDGDGVLDPGEVTSTSFICSGQAQVPFQITTTDLPLAVPGLAYSASIEAAGGLGGGFTWAVIGGALPAGISLASAGTPNTQLTGSTTAFGTFSFTVEVTDLVGTTATKAFSLDVREPLSFGTESLPPLTQGAAYSATLTGSGGSPPYTFAVVDSTLPAGLTLSAAGALSGTPTTKFGKPFLVDVTDSASNRVRAAFTIRGAREFFAHCGDTVTDAQADVFVGQISGSGTVTTTVATPAPGGTPIDVVCADVAMSPAGDLMAVVGDDGSGSEGLYLVDFSAFPTVTSTLVAAPTGSNALDVLEVAWSPDGRYIAYFGDVQSSGVNELFVADVSDPTAITTTVVNGTLPTSGDVIGASFRFSPDSRRLVYLADERLDGQNELFLFDLATSTNLGVINGTLATTSDDVDGDFEISADSKFVLYAAEQDVGSETELYIARIDGATPGAPIQVNPPLVSGGDIGETNFPAANDYSFAPNGEYIAYVADQDIDLVGQAYLVRTDAPGTAQLISPSNPGSSIEVFDLEWDHLGRRVLMRGDLRVNGVNELLAADALNAAGEPVVVNDDLVTNGDVDTPYGFSPDNSYVFYEADQDTANDEEPYILRTEDIGFADRTVRLFGGAFSDNVAGFFPSSDGSRLLVVIDSGVSTLDYELFSVSITPTTVSTPTRVNAALGTNQDVSTSQVRFVQDDAVVYTSDENTDNDTEAFFVNLSNNAKTALNPALPTNGDASTVYAQEF